MFSKLPLESAGSRLGGQPMIKRNPRAAFMIAVFATLFAEPAAAVDREILVDQAKVNAGGIAPGDAPGFPATLSQSGRYTLVGNLRVPAGQDGFVVVQHDVTLDLNGYTIRGNAQEAPAISGVGAEDVDGLRVVNGTITGFREFGIYSFSTDLDTDGGAITVDNMRILSNGTGIYSAEGRIQNSTIANNATYGIFCPVCIIEANVITGNTFYGITAAGKALVLGNVIAGNGDVGLVVSSVFRAGYGNNVLHGNNSGGAQVGAGASPLHPNVCQPSCP
jgi:hypothetical protein